MGIFYTTIIIGGNLNSRCGSAKKHKCTIIVDVLDISDEYVYYQVVTEETFDIKTVICGWRLEVFLCNWKGDGWINYAVEI